MKTTFLVFSCLCLISGLNASFSGFALENEENDFENEISPQLDVLYSENADEESLMPSYPRPRPTRSTTTTTTTPEYTTIPSNTTTTRRPRPTTTRRPRPTSTTRRPRPTTTRRPRPTAMPPARPQPTRRPRPELQRVQIYNNAVRSLGPQASRLVNIVLNRGKSQKTMQKNEILYRLNFMRRNPGYALEENEN